MQKENYPNSFAAAIVIGSSKITGLVGCKEPEGTLNVLAHIAVPSNDFINKGRVFNMEKMTNCLKTIKERLEEQINRSIAKFYVSIDTLGMHSYINTVNVGFTQLETMTPELLHSIMVRNREGAPNERIILETVPLEYRLGTTVTTDPIGVLTDNVQAQFLNIVCGSNAYQMLETCCRKAGITIARLTISALQLGNVVTTEQERTSGCAFIKMDSETTTVAVYKGKLLRHLAVIPLGGANVTRDIANVFNCEENEAEELKVLYGFPKGESEDESNQQIFLREGNRSHPRQELDDIIEARIEEIVQNVKHQIELSEYSREKLVNGLYIIGSTAQLPNISRAFDTHFKDWNVRILKTPSRLSPSASDKHFNEQGAYNVALGIIENAEIDCNGGKRNNEPLQQELFDAPQTAEATANEAMATATIVTEQGNATIAAPEPANNDNADTTQQQPEAEEAPKPKKKSGIGKFFKGIKNWIDTALTAEEEE